MKNELLHVISVISNPIRFRSRYELFHKFKDHVLCAGAQLHVVELAYGDRPFAISSAEETQFRTRTELWHKENLINLGISRLPPDWQYVAWVDADVSFSRQDWAMETVHQLQHYSIVQMFSHAIDLGPKEEPIQTHEGFAYNYVTGLSQHKPQAPSGGYYYYGKGQVNQWHPGYAWAARREALNSVGGLIEGAILGAADHHMAHAMIGNAGKSLPKGLHPNYSKMVEQWETRAVRHLKKDIGFVPTSLFHHFHGSKKNRFYRDRWQILIENQYDPFTDIKKDVQGILSLTDQKPALRDGIRAYFRDRDEDGTRV